MVNTLAGQLCDSVDGKMLCREAVSLFVVSLLALVVNGMPDMDDSNKNPSLLPFIQLTDGGIRFNFAGYHAQAGLGNLPGSGGLHASFGTPWGGHASAGLGGSLDGNNANIGGGLYARAGLGDGRHEATAGLGGVVDGSGSGPLVRGGLYAGATTAGYNVRVTAGIPDVGIPNSGPNCGPNCGPNNGPNNGPSSRPNDGNGKNDKDGDDGEKPQVGRSNIQVIARSGNKKEKVLQIAAVPAESPEAAKQLDSSPNKETYQVPNVEALSVVELAPALSNDVKEDKQIGNPRRERFLRALRGRLWEPRKQVVEPQDVADTNTQNVHKRQTIYYSDPNSSRRPPVAVRTDSGFFDDIFEIPRSTLNAVNRLLNNNYG
ncbi:hypothetical protein K0M31_017387 [Melipona bicolor]|uniref:Uncharacterized protein n=1 Tax=Melipona bicolor TaxID=60889 RepID=A0AA40G4R5_9HYME|nr:hypothetical protein K0M31_017387 [Melipona bicolor]